MSRRRQPHRIPPPISYGAESLDAEIVLHEESGELALMLWKTLRSVRLWSELPAEERPQAFSRDALEQRLRRLGPLEIDRDLKETLETAAAVLEGDQAHVEAVVTACRLIASWAEERGSLGTALEFTQAAAFLAPSDAEVVLSVATAARKRGELARAESWYRQAIAVGRRTHDWISFTGAYLGIGSTFVDRGNHTGARQALIRGIRAATRHSLWEERAVVAHELVRLAIATERAAEVVRAGRVAFEAYGADHPRLPTLVADLAVHWVRVGHARIGRPLLMAIDRAELDPARRLDVAGALGRSAGMDGDSGGLESAWQEARDLIRQAELVRESALPLLDLARGALAMESNEIAVQAAEMAVRSAEVRSDAELRARAEEVLAAGGGVGTLSREVTPRGARDVRELADALGNALAAAAAA